MTPWNLTAVGNTLYFAAIDGTNGVELWKSDGTASGTVMVKNIRSGSLSSSPYEFTAIGNTLYFAANDGTNGIELWKSDGTASGTVMVKDIYPGGIGNSGLGSSGNPIAALVTPSISEAKTEPMDTSCGRAMERLQAR